MGCRLKVSWILAFHNYQHEVDNAPGDVYVGNGEKRGEPN